MGIFVIRKWRNFFPVKYEIVILLEDLGPVSRSSQ